jgi:hypothetical protein
VLVLVRVRGRLVRHIALRRIWIARGRGWRTIVVATTNRGNVAERLLAGQVTVGLRRRGHLVATLRGLPRDLLPHTSGYVFAPVPRVFRGPFKAVIHVLPEPATAHPRTPALAGATRTIRLRL